MISKVFQERLHKSIIKVSKLRKSSNSQRKEKEMTNS
jgi:hypothetical protein